MTDRQQASFTPQETLIESLSDREGLILPAPLDAVEEVGVHHAIVRLNTLGRTGGEGRELVEIRA